MVSIFFADFVFLFADARLLDVFIYGALLPICTRLKISIAFAFPIL